MVEFTITGDNAICEILGAQQALGVQAPDRVRPAQRPRRPPHRAGLQVRLVARLAAPRHLHPGCLRRRLLLQRWEVDVLRCRRIDRAIIVELEHERYATLIVEVEDPERDVERIRRTAKLDQPPAARRR